MGKSSICFKFFLILTASSFSHWAQDPRSLLLPREPDFLLCSKLGTFLPSTAILFEAPLQGVLLAQVWERNY